ncbi:MAG: mechanosensitive ion channel [Blastocatellia bacterium]|nr:mechanosensitive ion channel [Blastocatellia bacterium]
MSSLSIINSRLLPGPLFLQDGGGILRRIWFYISYPLPFFNDRVSVGRVVIGIAVIFLTLSLAGRFSSLLDRRLAKRQHIDPGLRYTIARLVRYLFVIVGVLIALKQFSIDLTSIAVLFTALSVGIGFGLQYIAADIVSGFILLFERPVRVGDRITIGEDEGDVQAINLRTTLVMTNDRVAIIVPNSRLVSQRVINWSYGDPRARIPIPISVAVNSDVNLVSETLLLAAKDVDLILTDPAPKVQFLKFGDYSLDFRLLVWTRHPSRHPQIKSDINYRIERLFRERRIEIPYPTHEFLLKNVDDAVVRSALNAEPKAAQDGDPAGNSIPGEKIPRDN